MTFSQFMMAQDDRTLASDDLAELVGDDDFLPMASDREFRLGDGGDRIRLDGWE